MRWRFEQMAVRRKHSKRPGFTLIELLVVVAIIALLVSILIPALGRARAQGQKTACSANLKGMGLACLLYEGGYGTLPSGYLATGAYNDGSTDTSPGWGWGALILSYMSQTAAYNQIHFDLPITDPANKTARETMVKSYMCGGDILPDAAFALLDESQSPISTAAPSSYVACVGGDETEVSAINGLGAFYRNSGVKTKDITDGTSSTILLGERSWSSAQGTWVGAVSGANVQRGAINPNPGNSTLESAGLVLAHSHLNNTEGDTDGGLDDFSSNHPGGSNMAYADGSVHFVRSIPGDNPDGSYTQDSLYFQAYGTIANGDAIGNIDP